MLSERRLLKTLDIVVNCIIKTLRTVANYADILSKILGIYTLRKIKFNFLYDGSS